jgi:hypothetical protein
MKVVQLVGNGKGTTAKSVSGLPDSIASGGLVSRRVENALADDFQVTVQELVNRVDSQVRHAQVVGVRIDQRDRQPPAPVPDDGAILTQRTFFICLLPKYFICRNAAAEPEAARTVILIIFPLPISGREKNSEAGRYFQQPFIIRALIWLSVGDVAQFCDVPCLRTMRSRHACRCP